MGIFAIQQRVRVISHKCEFLVGLTGTITEIYGNIVTVQLDEVPENIRIKGKLSVWFSTEEIKAIEDERIIKYEELENACKTLVYCFAKCFDNAIKCIKEKAEELKKQAYEKQYCDFVFKLRKRYKRDILSRASNSELIEYAKLLIQWKYGVPKELIENYKEAQKDGGENE